MGMSDHALVKFDRFAKTIRSRVTYIKKRSFKCLQPDKLREVVAEMPELQAILQCGDADAAATLLTAGLTRVLDQMAPVKTIQTKQNYSPHMEEETRKLQSRRNSTGREADCPRSCSTKGRC